MTAGAGAAYLRQDARPSTLPPGLGHWRLAWPLLPLVIARNRQSHHIKKCCDDPMNPVNSLLAS